MALPDFAPTFASGDDARANRSLGIAEVARWTGITVHTLRYYERIGLVHPPRRRNGRRYYDDAALQRLAFITRMRDSGMAVRELRRYLELADARDPVGLAECGRILRTHRARLRGRIAALQLALTATDTTMAHLDRPETITAGWRCS